MKFVIALAIILVILGALAPLLKPLLSGAANKGPWPFHAKKLLSAPEQVLYHRLVAALPEHIVLAQVQMSRFLGVKKGTDKPRQWLNRINQKSVDFLVCGKDATVVAAIELDDKTHARPDRVAADTTKDRALTDAGVRIIRWNVKSMPDADAIKAAVNPPGAPSTPAARTATVRATE